MRQTRDVGTDILPTQNGRKGYLRGISIKRSPRVGVPWPEVEGIRRDDQMLGDGWDLRKPPVHATIEL